MDELLSEFISETQETMEALAGEIVAWEADPMDRERLDAIFRFFHTVKGSCGFLNLPRFERLSHAAEDVLSEIRAGKRDADAMTVSAVLAIMDRIGELAQAVVAGTSVPSESDDILIDALLNPDIGAVVVTEKPAGAETGPASAEARRPTGGMRSIRLPLSLIDQLMNGVSDMVLARNELSRKLRERFSDPELESTFERLSNCVADMRDAISKTRMQRVDRLFVAIPRIVRDVGRELGKKIDLIIEGGDVEMDREMVEMVVDPVTHIVRNAIDHGIEAPAERLKAGKAEAGHLRVAARQAGNQIVIEIADDGRGIDTDKLVARAIASNIISREKANELSDAARLDLIFAPGLSTAKEVTSVSGRGVGMDVVRSNVERIGGVIGLDNHPGRGLRITLRVPLTLTIIPGLIIRAGGQHFAIPRAAVVEILHDNNETLSIASVGGARVATIRNIRHSMIDLEDLLGLEAIKEGGKRTLVVIRSTSGVPFALGVQAVDNHEELVIRPAAPLVMASGLYAGMTLPDNGQPMLLLDASGLASAAMLPMIDGEAEAKEHRGPDKDVAAAELVSALMFTERTGEERLLRLSLVERVEDIPAEQFGQSAGQWFVRIEGKLLPVVHRLDDLSEGAVTALRLRDGENEFCYPVAHIMDIVQMPPVPDLTCRSGIISGVTAIEGKQYEVIDPFALLASVPEEIVAGRPVRCLLADKDDPWMQEILAPLIRQAGYEPVLDDATAANEADIVLCFAQSPVAETIVDRPVVKLRNAQRPQGPNDQSIYRYDRDALIAAIESAKMERAA
ncbi:chemotaxis protein CheA [Rhizorhapis sp.]|uniref:chemotaxis protein CheA n=1 Tax=Rhizorhapis sp. TaxID=1968842 RepID=UPI002B4743F1|nr:chemotaxis protein CheA [Rhizorhapis sp.]HKR15872.1 chemotaxis protein CheA [Rhizorhapis sp.]